MKGEGCQYSYNDVMGAIESFREMDVSVRKKLVERFSIKCYSADNIDVIGSHPNVVDVYEDLPEVYVGFVGGKIPVEEFMEFMEEVQQGDDGICG